MKNRLCLNDDRRVTAADVLTPEVLPPIQGVDHTGRFRELGEQLKKRLLDFSEQIDYYTARATSRGQMWNVLRLFRKAHEELEQYIEAMSKVEERWEEEEFQQSERGWDERNKSKF